MSTNVTGGMCLVMLVLGIAFMILFPLALLWAVYTIAPQLQAANPEAAYDFWHWLAAFVIMRLCGSSNVSKSSS